MTAARPTRPTLRLRAQGRSLLELLVALVIGMIILGAVLLTSISGNSSGRRQDGVATLNEDAQIAANLLGGHLRIAGYSRVVTGPSPTIEFRNYSGPGVRGCDGGVKDDSVTMAALECASGAAAGGPDALMVAYEGDAFNTFPTAGAPDTPTDCLGQTLSAGNLIPSDSPGATDPYWLVENIFYVNDNNELVCSGNGNRGVQQPLIGNVVDMQVTYGVADVPTAVAISEGTPETPFFEASRYLTASEVDALDPFPATAAPAFRGRWNRVVSARVCLVLRSAEELYDQITPYPGCDGVNINPPDRRAYRAVTITRAIKNKTAPCADAAAAPGAAAPAPDRCAF